MTCYVFRKQRKLYYTHIVLEENDFEVDQYCCRQLLHRPSHPHLSKATDRLIIWKRVIWYNINRIPKLGVGGTKHNFMFNIHYDALHILSCL